MRVIDLIKNWKEYRNPIRTDNQQTYSTGYKKNNNVSRNKLILRESILWTTNLIPNIVLHKE